MAQVLILLQAALSLLNLVQSNPQASLQDRQQAMSIAYSAMQQAQAALDAEARTGSGLEARNTPQFTPNASPEILLQTSPAATPVNPPSSSPAAEPEEAPAKPKLSVSIDSRSPAYLDTVYKLTADQPLTITAIVFELSPDEDVARVYPNGIPVRIPDGRVIGQVKTRDCISDIEPFPCTNRLFATKEPITITPDAFRYTELPRTARLIAVKTDPEADVLLP